MSRSQYDHRPRFAGITPLDAHPSPERGIFPVPKHFAPDSTETKVTYTVLGARELHCEEHDTWFELSSGLAVRAINAFFVLQQSRDAWVTSKDMTAGPYSQLFGDSIKTNSLSRGLDSLDELHAQTGEGAAFVQRSARGSGSRPSYRIDPGIAFVDRRTREQLRLVKQSRTEFLQTFATSIDQ